MIQDRLNAEKLPRDRSFADAYRPRGRQMEARKPRSENPILHPPQSHHQLMGRIRNRAWKKVRGASLSGESAGKMKVAERRR